MKRLITLAAGLTAATPALAHDGMHLHPHGVDVATALLMGGALVVIAAAAAVAVRVRK
ncbi:hypothetical protein [Actibacterium sp. D379-3]